MLLWGEIQIGTWVTRLDLTFLTNCSSDPTSISEKLYLSRTSPDGSATFTPFDTETSLVPDSDPFPTFVRVPGCNDCSPGAFPPNTHVPGNVPFRVVPDGQGGAFIPWWKDLGNFPNYQAHLAHVSGSAVTDVTLPLVFQNTAYLGSQPCPLPYFRPGLPCTSDFRVVLGENGVIFATDLKSVVALDATMAPLWTYSSASGMDLVAATADGGVTINNFQQGLVPLDANGNAGTPSGNSLLAVTPWALGNWMGDPNGGLAEFAGPSAAVSRSAWFLPNGNLQSQNSVQRKIKLHVMSVTEAGVSPFYVSEKVNTAIAYWQLNANILLDWDGVTITPVPACATSGPPGWSCSPGSANDITGIAALTLDEIQRRSSPSPAKGIEILFINSFQVGSPGSVHGYTPTNVSSTDGIHNLVILRDNSPNVLISSHEIGHVLIGPGHEFSIFNLMCGHDGVVVGLLDLLYPCQSSSANQLRTDQLEKARRVANTLPD